jgi:beta-glucosidase
MSATSLMLLLVLAQEPPYLDPARPVEERLADLLGRMTLEEKVAQLQCSIGDPEEKEIVRADGIGGLGVFLRGLDARAAAEKANRVQRLALEKTRLKIPILVHDEALHGIMGKGATSFPQAIALAATFDVGLMADVAAAIARETAPRGVHQVLSPVVNLALDVRWGRVEETYGEDPHLSARMGVAFCQPLESAGLITTPKHFAVNVGAGGRDSMAIDVSERWLRENEFVPFEACIREAGARSVMAAYSSLNGFPCSANRWLLERILRGEWGFRGIVVSDYGSVGGIMTMHHTAGTKGEAARQALEAGLDMELPDPDYYAAPLLEAVKAGRASTAALDAAVRRVLELKLRAGLFEKRSVDPDGAAAANGTAAHRELARRAARASIVLLRNHAGTLPLAPGAGPIAVLGPYADAPRLGGYSGEPDRVVTILDGLRARARVIHARGVAPPGGLPPIAGRFLEAEGGGRGLRGAYFDNRTLAGAPRFTRVDPVVDFDWGLGGPAEGMPADFFSARWTGKLLAPATRAYEITATTEDGVRLWIDDQLLIDSWINRGRTTDRCTARLTAGAHELRLEYYQNRGTASATLGWDGDPGKGDAELEAAVAAAKECAAAVVVAGVEEGEFKDRSSLDLPDAQERLIRAVAATGKPTIVVLTTGSAITMARWLPEAGAVLQAWYAGQEGGTAVADVLFGDANPAGRLPITFPRSVGQTPLVYNPRPTGRGWGYVDGPGTPLFPFGHGLSYTTFAYEKLSIEPASIGPDGRVTVSVAVRNTGARAGDEVAQLYLTDEVATLVRPARELRGFARVTLAPGARATVRFELGPRELAYAGADGRPVVEPGAFRVRVGPSSAEARAEGTFRVTP